jgi:Flp pilus assembly protein TadD
MQTYQTILEEAIKHINAKNYVEAEDILEKFLVQVPCDPIAMYVLGSMYIDVGRPGLAMTLLSASIHANPDYPPALSNLGVVLRTHGHEEAAKIVYEKAIALAPEDVDILANYSGLYVNQGDPEKAIELAERALKLDPSNPHAGNHRALGLLELGKYEEGFKQYKVRHNLPGWHNRDYGCSEWDGKETELLVISGEQGLGDEVLFMAWFEEAKRRVTNVVIECAERLVPLFERSFGVKCYKNEQELLKHHKPTAHISMGDLPALLGMGTRSKAWLRADPEKVEKYRAELKKLGDGPYIGLSWKGGLPQTHKHLRNVGTDKWARIAKYGTPVSLQYGDAVAAAEKIGIPHWPDAIANLDNLAALISACDYVVSVCNTTIHMAGALGVPVYVLVPSKPAWRYGLTGDKMPWYESATMIRQVDDWDSVYNQMEKTLASLCKLYRAEQKAA